MANDDLMTKLVSLCKRRGFIFQSSEIYGGIGGFWDFGPLGVELKRNIRDAWWRDMVTGHDDTQPPPGLPSAYAMVGLETSIVMHPQVWKVVGHYDLSNSRFGTVSPVRTAHKLKRGDSVRVDGPRVQKTGLQNGILISLILPKEASRYAHSGN